MQIKMQPPVVSQREERAEAVRQITDLVKEKEVVTGKPGRLFIIVDAARLAFKVYWQNDAFMVKRIEHGEVVDTQYFLPEAFCLHGIVDAFIVGNIYTPRVHSP